MLGSLKNYKKVKNKKIKMDLACSNYFVLEPGGPKTLPSSGEIASYNHCVICKCLLR